jgi:dimethylamine/trimethylamine dehydrogenase
MLADEADELGGRLNFETRLPGLSAWRRVVDYRLGRLNEMANVSLFPASRLGVDHIIEIAPDHVVLATGARWTKMLYSPLEIPVGQIDGPGVFTPDDIAAGKVPEGPVVLFDFDNYYMGGVLGEHLAGMGCDVHYVTPSGHASAWTIMSNELPLVHRALARRAVPVTTLHTISDFDGQAVGLSHLFTGEITHIPARSLVIVGLRSPRDELNRELTARLPELKAAGVGSIERIGDALAPGAIVHAVYSGHELARELGEEMRPARRDSAFGEEEFALRAEAAE